MRFGKSPESPLPSEVEKDREINPLVNRFGTLVETILSANNIEPDSNGVSRYKTSQNDFDILFVNFGEEPEGNGKPILYVRGKPTFGIRVFFDMQEYLFMALAGDEARLHRRYKYGSLLPSNSLPNLFTSQVALEDTQTEQLVAYVESPHLMFNKLHELLTLNPEECAEFEISRNETDAANAKLREDLERMRRWHTPRGVFR